MTKPNWFDWLVYRLFRWRWNRILKNNPGLLEAMRLYLNAWKDDGANQ